VLAILQNTPVVRFTAASTASFVLLMSCFSGAPRQLSQPSGTYILANYNLLSPIVVLFAAVQESSRRVRCTDSPLNSALGGAATGALLFASHGAAPPRGAVICATLGAGAHWAYDKLDMDHSVRSGLVAWGMLDPAALPPRKPPPPASTSEKEGSGSDASGTSWMEWVRPYLPLRKMTDAEWEAHQAKQDAAKQAAAALAGARSQQPDERN